MHKKIEKLFDKAMTIVFPFPKEDDYVISYIFEEREDNVYLYLGFFDRIDRDNLVELRTLYNDIIDDEEINSLQKAYINKIKLPWDFDLSVYKCNGVEILENLKKLDDCERHYIHLPKDKVDSLKKDLVDLEEFNVSFDAELSYGYFLSVNFRNIDGLIFHKNFNIGMIESVFDGSIMSGIKS